MRTHTGPTIFAIILIGFSGLSGCERVDSALDERESILTEREAIEAYTADIKTIWRLQDAFVSEVDSVRKQRDPIKIGQAYATRVAKSLNAYISALSGVSAKSDRLKALHKPLVTAHEQLHAAFIAFGADLTAENYPDRRAKLAAVTTEFHRAQLAYITQVERYYSEHGVERLPDPPIRLAR